MSSDFFFQKCVPSLSVLLCHVRMLRVLLLKVLRPHGPASATHILSFSHSHFLCFFLPSTAMCHAAETHFPHSWTPMDNNLLTLALHFIKVCVWTKNAFVLQFSPVRNDFTSPTKAISSQFLKMTSLRNYPHSFLDFEMGCIF